MKLNTLTSGTSFTIYAIDDGQSDSPDEYLESLRKNDPNEFRSALARLQMIADQGNPGNIRFMRKIGSIYEIKTSGGSRFFCFYDPNRMIFCVYAMKKPKDKAVKRVVKRTEEMMLRYREEYGNEKR